MDNRSTEPELDGRETLSAKRGTTEGQADGAHEKEREKGGKKEVSRSIEGRLPNTRAHL
jgi:hypothetical protein